jgi:hypothetical protein
MSRQVAAVLAILGSALFFAGCGGGERSVQIKGSIVEKGANVTFSKEKETFSLEAFYKDKSGDQTLAGTVNEDGSFVIDKVPPAVAVKFVVRSAPYPAKGDKDRFGGAFGDVGKSTLSYTTTDDAVQEVVIAPRP